MKFCQECGSKCEAVNGAPPKFCGNCGNPMGGVSTASTNPPKEANVDSSENVYENMFKIEGSDESVGLKAEDLIQEGKTNMKRTGRKQSLNDVKKRVQSNDAQDISE